MFIPRDILRDIFSITNNLLSLGMVSKYTYETLCDYKHTMFTHRYGEFDHAATRVWKFTGSRTSDIYINIRDDSLPVVQFLNGIVPENIEPLLIKCLNTYQISLDYLCEFDLTHVPLYKMFNKAVNIGYLPLLKKLYNTFHYIEHNKICKYYDIAKVLEFHDIIEYLLSIDDYIIDN